MRWGFDDAAATVLQRIRGEFREMPGLKLTIAQARGCGISIPVTAGAFLDALVIGRHAAAQGRRRISGLVLGTRARPSH